MAQLPPSAVFGSARLGQAVHVLLLIENSLPMMEHWQDLQQHILPGILGAVRIANPGINVQIFWETTGKTQDQRPAYKSQRHFNDFPDIDIVGLPRNKLSPLFIRQSIDLFVSGDNSKAPITRHLFIVAMSNPIDDSPGDHPLQGMSDDAKWDGLATKLRENNIILHVIANPLARLTRIFEIFRKTMRFQSRQEVIPWQPVDSTQCIAHLSGSAKYSEKSDRSAEDWPEVHLPYADPPSPTATSPIDMSDDEIPYPISPIDMINSNPGSLSLVSRMQALHGLASRRRPSERSRRPSALRSAFFRETSPAPSPRRERLLNSKSNSQHIVVNGNGAGMERERLYQLSTVALPLTNLPQSFSSALDLRGLTRDGATATPYSGELSAGPGASPKAMTGLHPPSPGSDASGSTMSSSLPSISSVSQRNNDLLPDGNCDAVPPQPIRRDDRPMQSLYPLKIGTSSQPAQYPISSGPISPAASGSMPDVSPTLAYPLYGPLPQNAYTASSYPSFSPFTSSYPVFATDQSSNSSYFSNADAISPTLPLPSIEEGHCEPDVVPASAPPDARGQVPFVFDPSYEAQSMQRLRRAIDSMHETGDSMDAGTSSASNLANGSWKAHGCAQTTSYIPELPETFYSVDRGRYDERQMGSYFTPSAKHYA